MQRKMISDGYLRASEGFGDFPQFTGQLAITAEGHRLAHLHIDKVFAATLGEVAVAVSASRKEDLRVGALFNRQFIFCYPLEQEFLNRIEVLVRLRLLEPFCGRDRQSVLCPLHALKNIALKVGAHSSWM